ncbi:hypothetical protein ANAPC5_01383 [Anaplasma phagocytophilum]|nr:hypothetical protein ANAPC5_01383 [Anaplasma phagocytophilum]
MYASKSGRVSRAVGESIGGPVETRSVGIHESSRVSGSCKRFPGEGGEVVARAAVSNT